MSWVPQFGIVGDLRFPLVTRSECSSVGRVRVKGKSTNAVDAIVIPQASQVGPHFNSVDLKEDSPLIPVKKRKLSLHRGAKRKGWRRGR